MEAVRRILNVSNSLPWKETVGHLNDFSRTMQISGYNQTERYHAISGAIARVSDMKKEIAQGLRSGLYRDGNQIAETKLSKKNWANTWFLKGNIKNTVSCPVTPGGVLKKELSKVINKGKTENDIQVIEDGGRPIHSGLSTGDPL